MLTLNVPFNKPSVNRVKANAELWGVTNREAYRRLANAAKQNAVNDRLTQMIYKLENHSDMYDAKDGLIELLTLLKSE